jgi:hypothetical protein
MSAAQPISIFFSYAREDEELRDELAKHLKNLERQGIIKNWHDRCILAGQEYDNEINKNLENADIILLLISPDFLSSDYCFNREVKLAMERYDRGEAIVVPIILRSCHWDSTPFAKLRALPSNGEAVATRNGPGRDTAFAEITKEIVLLLRKICRVSSSELINKLSEGEYTFQSIDDLVESTRKKTILEILERFNKIKVLGMPKPMVLGSIYTNLVILEKITNQRRLTLSDFQDHLAEKNDEDWDFLERKHLWDLKPREVKPGVEIAKKHGKLFILGKPGSGKTTFLKYLVSQCISDLFLPGRIPIFVSVKEFVEFSNDKNLLDFILKRYFLEKLDHNELVDLLDNGRVFIAFDGLDEVKKKDLNIAREKIKEFASKYYFSNKFNHEYDRIVSEHNRRMEEIIRWRKAQKDKVVKKYEKQIEKLEIQRQNKILEIDNRINSEISAFNEELRKIEGSIDSDLKGSSYKETIEARRKERQKTKLAFFERKRRKSYDEENQAIDKKIDKILSPEFQAIDEIFSRESDKINAHFPPLSNFKDLGLEFICNSNPDEYWVNHIIITCRIAAREYSFDNFTEVEVADFDDEQIKEFIHKWFSNSNHSLDDRNLLVSNIFKNINKNKSLKEVMTTPLLLTLLCLVIEDSGRVPNNRSELYEEGLDLLIKDWDLDRNILRDEEIKGFTFDKKKEILKRFAFQTFLEGSYFFKKKLIKKKLTNLAEESDWLNRGISSDEIGEKILKTFELQHGLLTERARKIYSFSHLTFQEYFTASFCSEMPEGIDKLGEKFFDSRWSEVVRLSLQMMSTKQKREILSLSKGKIDSLIVGNEGVKDSKKIREMMAWLKQKSALARKSESGWSIRALYLSLAISYSSQISYESIFSKYSDIFNILDNDIDESFEDIIKQIKLMTVEKLLPESSFRQPSYDSLEYKRAGDILGEIYSGNTYYGSNSFNTRPESSVGRQHKFTPSSSNTACSLIYAIMYETRINQEGVSASFLVEFKNHLKKIGTVEAEKWVSELRLVMLKSMNLGHNWHLLEEETEALIQYIEYSSRFVSCLKDIQENTLYDFLDSIFLLS